MTVNFSRWCFIIVGFLSLAATFAASAQSPTSENTARVDFVMQAQQSLNESQTRKSNPSSEFGLRLLTFDYFKSIDGDSLFLKLDPNYSSTQQTCLSEVVTDSGRQNWCHTEFIKEVSIRKKFSDTLTMQLGRQRWAPDLSSPLFHSAFDRFVVPLRPLVDALDLHLTSSLGKWSVLATDDVTTRGTGAFSATVTQPLLVLAWRQHYEDTSGFGLRFFRYDGNHSSFAQGEYGWGESKDWRGTISLRGDLRRHRFGSSSYLGRTINLGSNINYTDGSWISTVDAFITHSAYGSACSIDGGAYACRPSSVRQTLEGEVFLGKILASQLNLGVAFGKMATAEALDPSRSVCDHGCDAKYYGALRLSGQI